MTKTKALIKNQSGASVVEFALVLPLLILILFGIIEFALLLYNQQVITNATREGTRLGIIVKVPRVTNQEITDEIKKYAQKHLITFGSDTLEDDHIVITSAGTTFGSDLTVDVNYNYDFLVLSIPWFGFNQKTLKAVSTMRME